MTRPHLLVALLLGLVTSLVPAGLVWLSEIEAIERGEVPPSKKHQRQCIECLKDFDKSPGRGRPPKKCPECRGAK